MANLSQARSNILPKNVLTGCFLQEHIETQNLAKDQTLPAVAVLNDVQGRDPILKRPQGYRGLRRGVFPRNFYMKDPSDNRTPLPGVFLWAIIDGP